MKTGISPRTFKLRIRLLLNLRQMLALLASRAPRPSVEERVVEGEALNRRRVKVGWLLASILTSRMAIPLHRQA